MELVDFLDKGPSGNFGARVRSRLVHVRRFLKGGVCLDLAKEIEALESRLPQGTPRKSRREAKAAFGLVTSWPDWAAHVANHEATGPLTGDWLRALLLVDREPDKSRRLRTWKSLHAAIKALDRVRVQDLAVIQWFTHPVQANFEASRLQMRVDLAQAKRPEREIARVLALVDHVQESILAKSLAVFAEGFGPQTDRAVRSPLFDGAPSSSGDASDPAGCALFGGQEVAGESPTLQTFIARRSWDVLNRFLQPGHDHALLRPECQEVCEILRTRVRELDANPNHAEVQASVILLMSLCYSEHWEKIWRDLVQALKGASSPIGKHENGWWYEAHSPISDNARPQPERGTNSCWYLRRMLPTWIGTVLSAIGEIARADTLKAAIDHLEVRIRKRVPRFTLSRARLTLPVALYESTNDPCVSMLACGSAFGLTTGPLHYFAIPTAKIREHISAFHRRWCGFEEEPLGWQDDDLFIGAPKAAIGPQRVLRAVGELVEQARAAIDYSASGSATSLDTRIKRYNALIRYTAHMFLAGTAHRGHETIGLFTLADLHPSGVALLPDKPTSLCPDPRLTCIADIVLRQIEIVCGYRMSRRAGLPAEMHEALERSNRGETPLFQLVGPDGHLRQLQVSDLKWPDGLATNFYRSRTRMELVRRGVEPRLAYLQLGHVFNGLRPLSRESPESVIEIRTLLGPHLNSILLDDGWQILHPRYSPKALISCLGSRADLTCPPDSGWVRRLHQYRRDVAAHGVVRRTPEQREQDDATVAHALSLSTGGPWPASRPPRDVTVTPGDIALWRETIAHGRSPAHITRLSRLLWYRIRTLRRERGWTGEQPTIATTLPPVEPMIGTDHLRAHRSLIGLQELLRNPPYSRRDSNNRWGLLTALLITERTVYNRAQLERALLMVTDGDLHEIKGNTYLESAEGEQLFSARLSRRASVCARSLRGTPMPSLYVQSVYLRELLKPLNPGPAEDLLDRLFLITRLATRVEIPGTRWSLHERGQPNTLRPERTQDWILNRIGGCIHPLTPIENAPAKSPLISTAPRRKDNRWVTYRRLRFGLWKLREPDAALQGIPSSRYAEAAELCSELSGDNEIDPLVRLLALFAGRLISSADRVRVRTAHSYLTRIGTRLLAASDQISANDPKLRDLTFQQYDEQTLEIAYQTALLNTKESARPDVLAVLMRFHEMHHAELPHVSFYELASGICDFDRAASFKAKVVTRAEYDAIRHGLEAACQEGALNFAEELERKVLLSLLYFGRLRSGEATHLSTAHLFANRGNQFLWIRNSRLGMVKTAAGVRVVSTLAAMPRRERAELRLLASIARRAGRDGLFAADHLQDLLDETRSLLRWASGDPSAGLHDFRHAGVNHDLSPVETNGDPNRDYSMLRAGAVRRGHASLSVGYDYYFHLEHLYAVPEPGMSARAEAALCGRSEEAVSKGRSRAAARGGASKRSSTRAPMEPAAGSSSLPAWIVGELGPRKRMYSGLVELQILLPQGRSIRDVEREVHLSRAQMIRALVELLSIEQEFGILLLPRNVDRQLLDAGLKTPDRERCKAMRVGTARLQRLRNPPPFKGDPIDALTYAAAKRGRLPTVNEKRVVTENSEIWARAGRAGLTVCAAAARASLRLIVAS